MKRRWWWNGTGIGVQRDALTYERVLPAIYNRMVSSGLRQTLLASTARAIYRQATDNTTATATTAAADAAIASPSTGTAPETTGRYCWYAFHDRLAVLEEAALQRQPESDSRRYQTVDMD